MNPKSFPLVKFPYQKVRCAIITHYCLLKCLVWVVGFPYSDGTYFVQPMKKKPSPYGRGGRYIVKSNVTVITFSCEEKRKRFMKYLSS